MRKTAVGLLILLLCTSIPTSVQAQGNIPILTWRSHFSYHSVIDIARSSVGLYAASPNGLFFVDLQELSISKLTKNNGLSDVSIGAIGYDTTQDILVIGYANGNIDLVSGISINNLRSFRDASLIGSKTFHDVTFNNGLAYMSSDQGVLVVDLEQSEIVESYQNLDANGERLPVFSTTFFQDSIYAATSKGILSASLAPGVNRQDFNNWNRTLTTMPFSGIETDGIELIAASGSQFYSFDTDSWAPWQDIGAPIITFSLNGQNTLTLSPDAVFEVTDSSITTYLDLTQSQGTAAALLSVGADLWVGDALNGLVRYTNGTGQGFSPSGPASDESWLFAEVSGQVSLVHGGFSDNVTTLGRSGKISQFSQQAGWTNTPIALSDTDAIFDLVDIQVSSETEGSPLYLASFDRGLVSYSETEVTVINETSPNSTLIVDNSSVNMTAIAIEEGSIWMTNYGANTSLHQWEPSTDTWTPYALSNSLGRFPVDLFVAPNGDKWMPIAPLRGGGIMVFNETSNTERHLNTNGGQGGLPGRHVTSLALDEDFFLWVGTNEGIAFFPNLNSVLDGTSLTASVPIFENRLLLRDEFITAVAIDPGNRKWFGTQTNGLWLFSETGEAFVHHFTVDNSPLPSNNITSLFVERQSGEVFIGTDKGTVSFRSDATEGTNQHENVQIYPNPASASSVEQIVINGLVNNALIKITDVSGKLVREVRAQGGTALWNARDYNGQTVKTGVYLVFSSNTDGTETFVGKIAVI